MEELYELVIYWYGTNKPFKHMNSVMLYEQWTNIWFAKGKKQIEIDSYLLKYRYLINECLHYNRSMIQIHSD